MAHCWIIYIYFKLSGFQTSLLKPLITQLISGHILSVSLFIIFSENKFCIFHFISVAENLAHFVSLQYSAAAQCGNRWSRVIGLHSLERERTGHQSSANNLLEFRVPCEAVKTLAVHCHSDIFGIPGGHSAGCRPHWVCLQHHAII